jgi:hypothetical protein
MEKLIKGKWYQSLKSNKYYKHNYNKNGENYCSEYINENNVYRCQSDYNTLSINEIRLINISEIAHFLPKNHPDLQNKIYEVW